MLLVGKVSEQCGGLDWPFAFSVKRESCDEAHVGLCQKSPLPEWPRGGRHRCYIH